MVGFISKGHGYRQKSVGTPCQLKVDYIIECGPTFDQSRTVVPWVHLQHNWHVEKCAMINLHKEASIHIREDESQAAEIRHLNQPERGRLCVCCFSQKPANAKLWKSNHAITKSLIYNLQSAPTLLHTCGQRCSLMSIKTCCSQTASWVSVWWSGLCLPLQRDSSSSKCRSNQKATAFMAPAAMTSSFTMLSRPLPLRSPSKKYSNTLQGLVRQVWDSSSSWQVL